MDFNSQSQPNNALCGARNNKSVQPSGLKWKISSPLVALCNFNLKYAMNQRVTYWYITIPMLSQTWFLQSLAFCCSWWPESEKGPKRTVSGAIFATMRLQRTLNFDNFLWRPLGLLTRFLHCHNLQIRFLQGPTFTVSVTEICSPTMTRQ